MWQLCLRAFDEVYDSLNSPNYLCFNMFKKTRQQKQTNWTYGTPQQTQKIFKLPSCVLTRKSVNPNYVLSSRRFSAGVGCLGALIFDSSSWSRWFFFCQPEALWILNMSQPADSWIPDIFNQRILLSLRISQKWMISKQLLCCKKVCPSIMISR